MRAQEQQTRDQDEPIRLTTDLVTVTASVTGANVSRIKALTVEDGAVFSESFQRLVAR